MTNSIPKIHSYEVEVVWTDNRGTGTSDYTAYGRDCEIRALGKLPIPGSSDAAFRSVAARWNPEELLLASLSSCHQLWYLHLCFDAGVLVLAYEDCAYGVMVEEADSGGQFESVVLRPRVTISPKSDPDLAKRLHEQAHKMCFIARSVSFPVSHDPQIIVAQPSTPSVSNNRQGPPPLIR
jgi:organic hydroperoxide reductase OsmC/OhrA